MNEVLFKVVLTGKVRQGEDITQVKSRLAKLFRVEETRVEKLFSGTAKANVVRTRLSEAEALRYKRIIEQAGALCTIIQEQRPSGFQETSIHKKPSTAENPQKQPGEPSLTHLIPKSPLKPEERQAQKKHPLPPCPKCGYQAISVQDQLFTGRGGQGECPKCGIIIEKYLGTETWKHKPTLNSAQEPLQSFEFANFGKRVLARLIDVAIALLIFPILIPLIKWTFYHRNLSLYVLYSVIWTWVFLYLVVKYGGTPGKLLIKVRIVNEAGEYLGWKAAILRIVPDLIISLNALLQMYSVITSFPEEFSSSLSFLQIAGLINEFGGPYTKIGTVLGLFVYIDIGVILFNENKRAIHDFLAGSYVITKESYLNCQRNIQKRDSSYLYSKF